MSDTKESKSGARSNKGEREGSNFSSNPLPDPKFYILSKAEQMRTIKYLAMINPEIKEVIESGKPIVDPTKLTDPMHLDDLAKLIVEGCEKYSSSRKQMRNKADESEKKRQQTNSDIYEFLSASSTRSDTTTQGQSNRLSEGVMSDTERKAFTPYATISYQPQVVTLDPFYESISPSVWIARSEMTLEDAGYPESRFMYQMQKALPAKSYPAAWCIDFMRRAKANPALMNYNHFKTEFLTIFQPERLIDQTISKMDSVPFAKIDQYVGEFYILRSQVDANTFTDSRWIYAFFRNLPPTWMEKLNDWKVDRMKRNMWQTTTWDELVKTVYTLNSQHLS
ncbi:uncharacterized protein FA14DRAFT_185180 [Meira miltonrushii]|uniref:Retrotransposon gag domain-containing protein n=1 Tax=Meira miltonrushii TaxID=1280837 RepID=A0A316VCX8_9BASI|nr:uncharacterized protein FA14DRAFT_185180 [Meira miltonrushii]PWN33405.1 hypothetical protein FA14DRAFT_185180 [Meira miltonrushii]